MAIDLSFLKPNLSGFSSSPSPDCTSPSNKRKNSQPCEDIKLTRQKLAPVQQSFALSVSHVAHKTDLHGNYNHIYTLIGPEGFHPKFKNEDLFVKKLAPRHEKNKNLIFKNIKQNYIEMKLAKIDVAEILNFSTLEKDNYLLVSKIHNDFELGEKKHLIYDIFLKAIAFNIKIDLLKQNVKASENEKPIVIDYREEYDEDEHYLLFLEQQLKSWQSPGLDPRKDLENLDPSKKEKAERALLSILKTKQKLIKDALVDITQIDRLSDEFIATCEKILEKSGCIFKDIASVQLILSKEGIVLS